MNTDKSNTDHTETEKRQQIILIQENERKRIAGDLHDTVLQNLTHVMHQVELSQMYMNEDPIKAKLELFNVQKNLKMTIEEIRNLVFNLRPMSFDDLGFKETFDIFYDLIVKYSDIDVKFDVDDIRGDGDDFLLFLYRIAREALVNALRYSGGDKIFFQCKDKGSYVSMLIEDNGCGIIKNDSIEKNHYGLAVIKDRVKVLGGTLQIDTKCGTKISVEIPYRN